MKLKMGQEGVHTLLLSLHADFPAQCLLMRTGLLAEVLDVLGTPFLSSSTAGCVDVACIVGGGDGGNMLTSHPVGADGGGNLTPLAAIDWLDRLLDNLKSEYLLQLEGSLTSGMSRTTQSSGDHPGLNTAYRMVLWYSFVRTTYF